MNLIHNNIRGLRHNFEELIFTFNEKNIDTASAKAGLILENKGMH